MSLSINGKLNINDISRKDFELEAKSIGLGSKIRLEIKSGINRGRTRMCGYKISSILSKKTGLKDSLLKTGSFTYPFILTDQEA